MSLFRSQPRKFGIILLCIWLVATGALPLLGLGDPTFAIILNIIAIAAGVLIFLDR